MQKCESQERNLWAPKFEERTKYDNLKQERCARRDAWELAKDVSKLKKESKEIFWGEEGGRGANPNHKLVISLGRRGGCNPLSPPPSPSLPNPKLVCGMGRR